MFDLTCAVVVSNPRKQLYFLLCWHATIIFWISSCRFCSIVNNICGIERQIIGRIAQLMLYFLCLLLWIVMGMHSGILKLAWGSIIWRRGELRLLVLIYALALQCYILRLLLVRIIGKHKEILIGITKTNSLSRLMLLN